MKFFITILFTFCCACLLSAADFNLKQLVNIRNNKDWTTAESTALSMKDSAKTESAKGFLVESITFSRNKLGKYTTTDAALADIDAVAKEIGVSVDSDSVRATKLMILFGRNENERAAAISATWTGTRTSYRRGICLDALKRYAEASVAFAASRSGRGYIQAAKAAKRANLAEKVFEYCYTALSNDSVKKPEDAIELVNAVLDANYNGTTITSAKIKEFLQMVNRKYSRKLVVNAPTKWDTLIQLVRQTLETY